MITDYIGGEGSAETPKNDYVIYGWPLMIPYLMKFSMVWVRGSFVWHYMVYYGTRCMEWHCRALWQCDRGEAGCPLCHLSIGHLVGTPQCIGHPTMCPTSLFLISSSQSRSQTLQLPMQISIPKSSDLLLRFYWLVSIFDWCANCLCVLHIGCFDVPYSLSLWFFTFLVFGLSGFSFVILCDWHLRRQCTCDG